MGEKLSFYNCFKAALCNRVGHLACDCRSPTNADTANYQRGTRAGQKATFFEYGEQGHFKRKFLKLKNNNRSNHGRNGNVPAEVYVVGNAGTNPDYSIVTGTFLLNNCYATILSDTGVDRSFMSTTFSSQIDITPTTLDHYYDVELADMRIAGNKKEHEEHLKAILELLKKEDLYAKFSKCEFWILKGKINPRYVGPFKVLEKVGSISYKLKLPQELSMVHNTFHVSNLKKCYSDDPFVIPLDGHHVDDKLHFMEEPIEIMDREVKRLKRSRIPIVKV
uniref:Putative reverse transcriptase domain-containing protein n=1 Tax=Tanacetum cinerariifolium TaxID=118510 RepID=A0A6L2KE55_TANCI|nr:putative reverse transcriptase domain-containing protein [Tanacetum cinerariifolium]